MAINFIVIFPLGALAARQLRSHWLRSPAVRASLFYVHIATQVCVCSVPTYAEECMCVREAAFMTSFLAGVHLWSPLYYVFVRSIS